MQNDYSKAKGRGNGYQGHLELPKTLLRNPNFLKLSAHGNKLLIDIGEQFLGKNNGDLCATWTMMKKRGWKSKDTLNNALKELRYYEFIVQTQFGGLNLPSLYALAWKRIDIVKGESDYKVGDRPAGWKQTKKQYVRKYSAKKKTQVRLAYQSSTADGAVRDKITVKK